MQVLQIGVGFGVLLPAGSIVATSGQLTGTEVAFLAGLTGGALGLTRSLSWFCERLIGEISWRPAQRALRISTLTMWGNRRDRDYAEKDLMQLGFRDGPTDWDDELPDGGGRRFSGLNLSIEDTTFLLFNNERHVHEPETLGRL
eukprot:5219404-Prymnesium_polylepis.2